MVKKVRIVDYCLRLPYSKRVQLMAALKESILQDADKEERRNPRVVPQDRGQILLSAMGRVLGERVDMDSRTPRMAWAKAMVGYQLLQEGCTLKEAGRHLGKDHSSLSYMRNKMQFVRDHPYAYEDVTSIWKQFQKQIKDDIHTGTDADPLQVGGEL